jgi:hypothetical protein
MISVLDSVRTRGASDPVEKLTDSQLLQSLASELVSPNIKIHSSSKSDKETHDFAASMASVHRLLNRKTKNLDRKYEISDLYHLLKHTRKLRKILQETMGPA